MSNAKWTTTPPTEPGYYWFRPGPSDSPAIGLVGEGCTFMLTPRLSNNVEWWPIPIPEPPREETSE